MHCPHSFFGQKFWTCSGMSLNTYAITWHLQNKEESDKFWRVECCLLLKKHIYRHIYCISKHMPEQFRIFWSVYLAKKKCGQCTEPRSLLYWYFHGTTIHFTAISGIGFVAFRQTVQFRVRYFLFLVIIYNSQLWVSSANTDTFRGEQGQAWYPFHPWKKQTKNYFE